MSSMDFFTAMEVSASGLSAERTRMNIAASNLANAQTTQAAGGGPYKRRDVVLSSVDVPGAMNTPFAQAVRGSRRSRRTRRRRGSSTTPGTRRPTRRDTSRIRTSTPSKRWST
jgi:flagellar basal body rod protein FlgC